MTKILAVLFFLGASLAPESAERFTFFFFSDITFARKGAHWVIENEQGLYLKT